VLVTKTLHLLTAAASPSALQAMAGGHLLDEVEGAEPLLRQEQKEAEAANLPRRLHAAGLVHPFPFPALIHSFVLSSSVVARFLQRLDPFPLALLFPLSRLPRCPSHSPAVHLCPLCQFRFEKPKSSMNQHPVFF
jgi:hypothetical protein